MKHIYITNIKSGMVFINRYNVRIKSMKVILKLYLLQIKKKLFQ
jgi:hypothetical protein